MYEAHLLELDYRGSTLLGRYTREGSLRPREVPMIKIPVLGEETRFEWAPPSSADTIFKESGRCVEESETKLSKSSASVDPNYIFLVF